MPDLHYEKYVNGRAVVGEPREMITVRLYAKDYGAVHQAATIMGISMNAFCAATITKKAKQVLRAPSPTTKAEA